MSDQPPTEDLPPPESDQLPPPPDQLPPPPDQLLPKSLASGLQPPTLPSVPYLPWEGRGRGYPESQGSPKSDTDNYYLSLPDQGGEGQTRGTRGEGRLEEEGEQEGTAAGGGEGGEEGGGGAVRDGGGDTPTLPILPTGDGSETRLEKAAFFSLFSTKKTLIKRKKRQRKVLPPVPGCQDIRQLLKPMKRKACVYPLEEGSINTDSGVKKHKQDM